MVLGSPYRCLIRGDIDFRSLALGATLLIKNVLTWSLNERRTGKNLTILAA